MFERFSDRARRCVALAQEEARTFGHNYIGSEHILLGLIHEGEGIAARVLRPAGFTSERVRKDVETLIGQGQQAPSGHVRFTPRAKKVFELSLREALQLGHNYIGAEHILLGLIHEGRLHDGQGCAARILAGEADQIRQDVIKTILTEFPAKKTDMVNHPPHYKHPSGIECIRVTQLCPFSIGNAIKYCWRAQNKNGNEDLKKARWYLQNVLSSGAAHYPPFKANELLAIVVDGETDPLRRELLAAIRFGELTKAIGVISALVDD